MRRTASSTRKKYEIQRSPRTFCGKCDLGHSARGDNHRAHLLLRLLALRTRFSESASIPRHKRPIISSSLHSYTECIFLSNKKLDALCIEFFYFETAVAILTLMLMGVP